MYSIVKDLPAASLLNGHVISLVRSLDESDASVCLVECEGFVKSCTFFGTCFVFPLHTKNKIDNQMKLIALK